MVWCGDIRMLIYEYIDNGSLHHWLHVYDGELSPLTWDRRMSIIRGTAKGYRLNRYQLTFIMNYLLCRIMYSLEQTSLEYVLLLELYGRPTLVITLKGHACTD